MAMIILHSMRTNVAVTVLETVNIMGGMVDHYDDIGAGGGGGEGKGGETDVSPDADDALTATVETIEQNKNNNNENNNNQDRLAYYNKWTTREVSYVHAAFYVGYVGFQLPAAWSTTKLPSNRMLCLAVFTTCTLNLIIPSCFNG